jgi:hypothetical protein
MGVLLKLEEIMKFWLHLFAFAAITAAYSLGLWLDPLNIITFALGIPACNWLANLFHELGHLLAYRLLKLEWKRMVISCFVLEHGKAPRVDSRQGLFSASCTCAYRPCVPFWRYCVALLSGSIAGLLLAAVAIAAAFFSDGAAGAFFLHFAVVCGLNALVNLLPFSTDMALLRSIKHEREKTE